MNIYTSDPSAPCQYLSHTENLLNTLRRFKDDDVVHHFNTNPDVEEWLLRDGIMTQEGEGCNTVFRITEHGRQLVALLEIQYIKRTGGFEPPVLSDIENNMCPVLLYHHKTEGGARYLTDKFVECSNGEKEGVFEGATILIRLDGEPELTIRDLKIHWELVRQSSGK